MSEVQLPVIEFDADDFEIIDMPSKSPAHIEVPEWVIDIAKTLNMDGTWKRFTPKPGKGTEAMANEFARLIKGAARYFLPEDKSINAIVEGVGVRFHIVGKRGAKPKDNGESA